MPKLFYGHVPVDGVRINYYRTGGLPMLGNWQPYAAADATPDQVADLFAKQTPDASQTWADLETIRSAWPGD